MFFKLRCLEFVLNSIMINSFFYKHYFLGFMEILTKTKINVPATAKSIVLHVSLEKWIIIIGLNKMATNINNTNITILSTE